MDKAYTLAQKAKSVVAGIGALAAVVGSIAAYLITTEFVDDNVKAWAATVAAACGVMVAAATKLAVFNVPNAPAQSAGDYERMLTEDTDPPADPNLEGTH